MEGEGGDGLYKPEGGMCGDKTRWESESPMDATATGRCSSFPLALHGCFFFVLPAMAYVSCVIREGGDVE